MAAGGTALAGLVAFGLFGVGCSTGGTGTRDEGPAGSQPVAQITPRATPSGTTPPVRRVDAVRLLKDDPKVGEQVRDGLKPCAGRAYPIDTSYGSMTGGRAADVVVNVMSCADSVGVGTYVYRADGDGAYKNVFAAEVPAVYGTIDRGDLVVTIQVYGSKDPLAYPSGSEVVTYRWASDRFTEHDRVHNDFSRAVEGTDGELPVQSEPMQPVEPMEPVEPVEPVEPAPSDTPAEQSRN
ncbi:hypothetical protein AB0J13_18160 [Streptomyces anulatus]|uniref:hypothetical protein n=1 Tax=Streptomyces anulatus TaxID=1892 RepID=UPI0033FF71A9